MPWTIPPPTYVHPAATLTWRQEPSRGETCGGDALFVEADRTDGGMFVLLLDVSGHGKDAAVTVDFVGDLIRQSVFDNHGPDALLTLLHERLQSHWAITGRHIEGVAVLIDAEGQALCGCRAGVSEVRLGRPGGAWILQPVDGQSFLGIPHDFPYCMSRHSLEDGAWLLAFTDGVSETGQSRTTETGQSVPLFRQECFPAFLAGLAGDASPSGLLDLLWTALRQHGGASWPEDDVTALVVTRQKKTVPSRYRNSPGSELAPRREGDAMSEQNAAPQVRPEVRELNRLLVELRARMGFGAYRGRDDALDTAQRIVEKLLPLLKEIDPRDAPAELLDGLLVQMTSGELYAFYMGYLRKLSREAFKAEEKHKKELTGLPDDDILDGGDDQNADVGARYSEEDRQSFLDLYQDLLMGLESVELEVMARWITVKGEKLWQQTLAGEMYERQSAVKDGPSPKTLEYLKRKVFRFWYKVQDQIHDVFGKWLQGRARENEEVRLELEKPEVVAKMVLRLIGDLCPPTPRAQARVVAAAGSASGSPPAQGSDIKQQQREFLRTRQRDLMYDRARRYIDKTLDSILKGYRGGKSNTDLMREVYGAAEGNASDRLEKDLDLLHSWYEEITREARRTLKAWNCHLNMRHMGLKEFREKGAALADFGRDYEPILKAAQDRVPFPALPDRLGLDWGELTDRVLRLRDLCSQPRDEGKQKHSLGP